KIGYLAHRSEVLLEDACGRVADDQLVVREQRVVADRCFERLVVNRERSFDQAFTGKEAGHAFRIHDERTHAASGIFIELEVGYIGAHPGLAVPVDEATTRVKGLASGIARCTVVHNAAVGWPGPGPIQGLAYAGG